MSKLTGLTILALQILPMLAVFVPPSIRSVYYSFKDIFTDNDWSYQQACSLLLYFIFGSASLCEFVRNCSWAPSVSTLSRKISNFKPNRFIRRNQQRILRKLNTFNHGDFCFAVDDTANPKYGATSNYSSQFHSSSGPFFGQKILLLVIVDLKTRVAYPINYIFLTSKKDPHHITAHKCATNLIEEALNSGFPPLSVTSDSWFDSKEFIKDVSDLGCTFAGELKGNRIVRENSFAKSSRQKIKSFFANIKRVRLTQTRYQKRKEKRGKSFSQKILFIQNYFSPLKVIAVYNRKNGLNPFAYYATTDTTMTGARLWRLSRARWAIEVLFRDLKQSLGFGSLTAGGEGGAHLSVCIPLILLTSIRLDQESVWFSKKGDTLGSTVKKLRESALFKSIDLMTSEIESNRVIRMKARRKNPNKKPSNLCGERKIA